MAAVYLVFSKTPASETSPVILVFGDDGGGATPDPVEGAAAGVVAAFGIAGAVAAAFGAIEGRAAASVATFTVAGAQAAGAVGAAGAMAAPIATLALSGGAMGQVVTFGAAHAVIHLAGAITGLAPAQHPRHELRGEVRLGGVLVNRRVRAYARDTGALLGEADTVAGKFRVHAGFAAIECYATPIDLSPGATDWLPPTANRILAVLASDTA